MYVLAGWNCDSYHGVYNYFAGEVMPFAVWFTPRYLSP